MPHTQALLLYGSGGRVPTRSHGVRACGRVCDPHACAPVPPAAQAPVLRRRPRMLLCSNPREETTCRFCKHVLPDWRHVLSPPALLPAPSDPVMVGVGRRGQTGAMATPTPHPHPHHTLPFLPTPTPPHPMRAPPPLPTRRHRPLFTRGRWCGCRSVHGAAREGGDAHVHIPAARSARSTMQCG